MVRMLRYGSSSIVLNVPSRHVKDVCRILASTKCQLSRKGKGNGNREVFFFFSFFLFVAVYSLVVPETGFVGEGCKVRALGVGEVRVFPFHTPRIELRDT